MNKIERRYHFHAAHRVFGYGKKCERIHGHTYKVRVIIPLRDGEYMPFSSIDDLINPVISAYCHKLMLCKDDPICSILKSANEVFLEFDSQPTCEMISKHIYESIKALGISVESVYVSETESSEVCYVE